MIVYEVQFSTRLPDEQVSNFQLETSYENHLISY